MGFYTAFSPCLCCTRPFSYNPHYVPSKHGEPVCPSCMALVNAKRVEKGLEPFQIHPKAYEPEDDGAVEGPALPEASGTWWQED